MKAILVKEAPLPGSWMIDLTVFFMKQFSGSFSVLGVGFKNSSAPLRWVQITLPISSFQAKLALIAQWLSIRLII